VQYLTVKNLELYHPGYKDRVLHWCKTHFKMLNADPEFEELCEIDKWRFMAFVMLELQIKKPVPLNPEYLKRKGFDLQKRPISLTIQMLHNFVNTVTQESKLCTKSRVEESRVEESRVEESRVEESRVEIEENREEKKGFFNIPDCLNTQEFIKTWNEWVKYRSEIKKPINDPKKPTSAEKQLLMLAKLSMSEAISMIENSMTNGWVGLFRDKNGTGKNRRNTKEIPYAEDSESIII